MSSSLLELGIFLSMYLAVVMSGPVQRHAQSCADASLLVHDLSLVHFHRCLPSCKDLPLKKGDYGLYLKKQKNGDLLVLREHQKQIMQVRVDCEGGLAFMKDTLIGLSTGRQTLKDARLSRYNFLEDERSLVNACLYQLSMHFWLSACIDMSSGHPPSVSEPALWLTALQVSRGTSMTHISRCQC